MLGDGQEVFIGVRYGERQSYPGEGFVFYRPGYAERRTPNAERIIGRRHHAPKRE
jgi:hypothetical protein